MNQIVTVDFQGDLIFACNRDDGIYVAVKPICDSLGLKWSTQHERLKADPVLSEGILLAGIPSPSGTQETTVLLLEYLPGWLFKVDSRRVNEGSREKLLAYQRECYAALYRHFYGGTMPGIKTEQLALSDSKKRQLVAEGRMCFGPRAGAQLWIRLGLPIVPEMMDLLRQPDLFIEPPAIEGTLQ